MNATSSWRFPNIFDTVHNQVATLKDSESVVNRTRLLLHTQPTEMFMNLAFGVGLKSDMWKYNNAATRSIIENEIREQLRLYEPCAVPEDTVFNTGLLYTEDATAGTYADTNEFKMTVSIATTFGDEVDVEIEGEGNKEEI